MNTKHHCAVCAEPRSPRQRLCARCRAIVRTQQEARIRQEKAKKAPLTLHELTIVLQRLQAQRGQGATS